MDFAKTRLKVAYYIFFQRFEAENWKKAKKSQISYISHCNCVIYIVKISNATLSLILAKSINNSRLATYRGFCNEYVTNVDEIYK